MARKLIVEIVGDTSRLEKSFRRGREEAQAFGGAVGKLRVGFATLAKSVVIVEAVDKALEGLNATIHAGIEEVSNRAKVNAQVNAALKSTGNAAHTSAQQIDELAKAESNLSGFDDEMIKSGEAVLLTFRNIQNFGGKGNQIFDRATKIMVDFAAKTGKSMPQAGLAIGRALQDPAKAAGALRRAQVVLTESEKKAIDTAVKHGDTLKAQKLILQDLQIRYGGQAKALGQTLPGMINVLRERLKDLAGDLGEKLQGPLKHAVRGVTDFVKQLSEARGTKAKVQVVLEGAEDLGRKIFDLLKAAVESAIRQLEQINWRGIADAIRDKLASIDWAGAIRSLAQNLSKALVYALNAVTNLRDRIDWQKVGKYIVDGLGLAIAAAIQFLRSLDWGAIAKALARFALSAFKAAANLYIGIGKEVARLLFEGLKKALAELGQALERVAIDVVLKMIEPFTHIPLVGRPFRALKNKLQAELAAMGPPLAAQAYAIGTAIGEHVGEGIRSGAAGAAAAGLAAAQAAAAAAGGGGGRRGRRGTRTTQGLPAPPTPHPTAEYLAQLKREQEKRMKAYADALQFNVDKAGVTATASDDLAALYKLQSYLKKQIAVHKGNLDLQRQLLDVQKQITDVVKQQGEAAAQAREARQFRYLGFGPTGEDLVPGIGALKRMLAQVRDAIEGSFLDTRKTQSMLNRIRRVLSGGLGAVGRDVREKIQSILQDLRQQLNDAPSAVVGFRQASVDAIIKSLGLDLTPAQLRQLRLKIAQLGPNLTVPGGTSAAFAGAGAHGGVTVNGDVHVHGVTDVRTLENQLTKRASQRAHTRRGAR